MVKGIVWKGILIVVSVMLTGCATLLSGETSKVYFHTNPEGAKISVNGQNVGETGSEVLLKNRLKHKTVSLSKEGYETETFEIKTSFDTISLLNIIGFYGFLIDWATGALVKYDQVYYDIDLKSVDKKDTAESIK